ncbi:MAG: hypothetical protein RIS70_4496, partial [Planctomycetota bacterium]
MSQRSNRVSWERLRAFRCVAVCAGLLTAWAVVPLQAQQDGKPPLGDSKPAVESKPAADKPAAQEATPKDGDGLDDLTDRQGRLSDRYARLEDLIARMAAFESSSNPKRAQLLRQALQQSKDRLTLSQMNSIVKLLNQNVLDRAIQGQGSARGDLQGLLELLQTENRADRLKSEQQRIKEYIKEIERLQRQERSLQGQTESGNDQKQLTEEQARIAEKTG